ncbi:carbohydrate kinase family protein [Deinococcus sp. YIM 134068]|uniref:carbohydrate kinase family protein n=1 Tax=Deinococcus lichenicola TaxID=3118910 RepID=UPI002F94F1B0
MPAPDPPHILVVGGANVDIKARTLSPIVLATSNPGTTTQRPGGVARNVAENLARLGVSTRLITAIGRDALGELLLSETATAGVDVRAVLQVDAPTGTYTAVLDSRGELLVAVAAMDVLDTLTPSALDERLNLMHGAAWVVADGNLSAETLTHLLLRAREAGVPVAFEPVSVPKAARLLPALAAGMVPNTVTPNVAELSALVGRDVPNTPGALREAADELHALGIHTVWIRRGARGSLLSTPEEAHELPAQPARVADVTGAGDAMLAAYLAALLAGHSPREAARHGHAAAALTVESEYAVSPTLSPAALRSRLG